MALELKLTRDVYVKNTFNKGTKEDATLGVLTLKDKDSGTILFKCFTCEPGGPSTDKANTDKRIMPKDTYYLEWTDSSRNASLAKKYPKYKCSNGRNKALWIKDRSLSSFASRRVLIHVGNFSQDSLACILLGTHRNTKLGSVSNSVECVREFFECIENIGDLNSIQFIIEEAL